MSLASENVSGLRKPTRSERELVAEAWQTGTNVAGLKKLQMIVWVFVLVMAALRAMGGENGFSLGAGIATGILVLVLCSPFLLIWNAQISKIRKRQHMLDQGCFTLVEARGEKAVFNRWNVYHVGFATVMLANGTVYHHVEMPYTQAVRLQKTKAVFSGYVVLIEGENKCIMFPG